MKTLTTGELAERLRVTPETLRAWRAAGKGPMYMKMGDSPQADVRYRLEDVIEWEEACLIKRWTEPS